MLEGLGSDAMLNSPPRENDGMQEERLRFDHERLMLKRQKLAVETRLKRRELQQGNKKNLLDRLANPLSLAIVGGFITLMTSILTTTYSAYEGRAAAKEALEAELIKKFVEGPTETVRANLRFLVDANFLPDYARGIGVYLKNNPEEAPSVGAAIPRSSGLFEKRATQVMQSLISDFGFTDVQAAGILGNIAYETTGFRVVEEINPIMGGRGGIGYAMWTAMRRTEFEAFARQNNLEPTSPEANYRFLKQELKTTQSSVVDAVKKTATIEDATRAFQNRFVHPAFEYANFDYRVKWAQLSLQLFQSSTKADSP